MTVGRSPLSIFCSRDTPPRVASGVCLLACLVPEPSAEARKSEKESERERHTHTERSRERERAQDISITTHAVVVFATTPRLRLSTEGTAPFLKGVSTVYGVQTCIAERSGSEWRSNPSEKCSQERLTGRSN